MILAIWTKSPPKVRAIETASEKCVYFKWEEIKIISEKVESWVWDMPISLEENIQWAKNRANNIKILLESQNKTADFYIWMEGWTQLIWKQWFVFWVVYIINSDWEEHFSVSNLVELPQFFQTKIYDEQADLWPILAEVTKNLSASEQWWAFWYWTDNMLTRKTQFEVGFIWAISPFYNKYYKL